MSVTVATTMVTIATIAVSVVTITVVRTRRYNHGWWSVVHGTRTVVNRWGRHIHTSRRSVIDGSWRRVIDRAWSTYADSNTGSANTNRP